MNKRQYEITKDMVSSPFSSTKKWAKLIKVSEAEVLRVKMSLNFEQYQSGDINTGDLFGSMFGGF